MYQTELEYTYKEYRKMQRRIFERNIIIQLLLIAIATPFIIMLLKDTRAVFPYTIGIIACVVIIKYICKLVVQNREGWKLESKREVRLNKYTFFDDYFEMKNENAEYKIPYSEINGLVETKTHFYIKNKKHNPFIIKKENCSDELIQYIRKFKH